MTAPAPPRRRASRRDAAAGALRAAGTPAILRLLLAGLIAASLVWGGLAAWAIGQHAAAASEVVSSSEPLSLDAQQMYQSLSDADVTATTAFLAGPPEPLAVRQHYQADIARAAADLAALRSAGGSAGSGDGRLAAGLAAVSAGLPVYAGYVSQAQDYGSLGYPLTGGSFMQVASEEMHLTLLPAARAIYAQENAALMASSARATGLPWLVIVAAIALGIGYALLRTQRWLTRRTHRTVNYGLLAATLAAAVGLIWLFAAFAAARSDLGRGIGHGSAPAELLARADIAAQQARGDEVLNLISRSGSTSFQADFLSERNKIGPGSGTLLDLAATESPSGAGAAAVAAAQHDAPAWYSATGRVFRLDVAAHYADETRLVLGTGAGSSAAGFARLQRDLRRGLAADQVVFRSGASAGSGAFGGLEAGLAVAALIMAGGSAWGLSRRLAEYR